MHWPSHRFDGYFLAQTLGFRTKTLRHLTLDHDRSSVRTPALSGNRPSSCQGGELQAHRDLAVKAWKMHMLLHCTQESSAFGYFLDRPGRVAVICHLVSQNNWKTSQIRILGWNSLSWDSGVKSL
ncbi:unnamed protein product [Rangifer tarandus platyrhynchus]|uniref:Uncharacterized protein n=2 Tax=Rangifer tarandus platyrhynchus TaxID=3082113 RepID=A0AC59ZUY3_RANTA|nr:unnamed protein product [Rangifer tarandus platyrhynchus]